MNILSRIRDIRPCVKYMMSRIRDNRPMSVKAILFCGRQGIALRGHRDDSTSKAENLGNFHALLTLLSDHDDNLKKHLELGKKNARYTSKTIQNEIIEIIGQYIREKVTNGMEFFSIIADEVTSSVSNQEILSVCLRYVSTDPVYIKEVFFDFVYLERTNGVSIAEAIKQCLEEHGIDISLARGQAYDGASAMSFKRIGVQSIIRQKAPLALYTHCKSHVLNLSIAASCQLPLVRNMIDVVNSTSFL